jgi:hypothetical protein
MNPNSDQFKECESRIGLYMQHKERVEIQKNIIKKPLKIWKMTRLL